MDMNVAPLVVAGLLALTTGGTGLAMLVRHDLGRASRLGAGGQILLAAAIGLGLIAFSIKLAIIGLLAGAPHRTLMRLVPTLAPQGESYVPDPTAAQAMAMPLDTARWRALPAVAPDPADNPTTPAKVALGRRLFFDANLSADRTVACASCHDLERGGADNRPTALGIGGQTGARNAPTVFNAAFQAHLFWDGRARTLEQQAMGPFVNPIEMGMASMTAVAERVRADAAYAPLFEAAFGAGSVVPPRIAEAIAAFERTLVTPDSRFDRFVRGEASALTAREQRGMARFEDLGCVLCHSGPNFSGAALVGPSRPYAVLAAAGTAYAARYDLLADKGRGGADSVEGVWRIPSLRNVAVTGPYLHNGSIGELAEVVRVMASLQARAALETAQDETRRVIQWEEGARTYSRYQRRIASEEDIADIVAFLSTLTGARFEPLLPARRD